MNRGHEISQAAVHQGISEHLISARIFLAKVRRFCYRPRENS